MINICVFGHYKIFETFVLYCYAIKKTIFYKVWFGFHSNCGKGIDQFGWKGPMDVDREAESRLFADETREETGETRSTAFLLVTGSIIY